MFKLFKITFLHFSTSQISSIYDFLFVNRQLESSLQGKTTSASSSMQSSNNKNNSSDECIVRKLMLDSWNESIFSDIKHRLQESAMKLVHAERNGEAFDSQLVIGE